jgi:hypothetical protein
MSEFENIIQKNFRFSIAYHPMEQVEVMQLLSKVMQSYQLSAMDCEIVANWFHQTYKDGFCRYEEPKANPQPKESE